MSKEMMVFRFDEYVDAPIDVVFELPESVMKSFLNSPPKPDIIMLSTSLS